MRFLILTLVVLALNSVNSINPLDNPDYIEKYRDHALFKIHVKNEKELKTVQNLRDNLNEKINIWRETKFANDWILIRVAPSAKPIVEDVLQMENIKYEITNNDVAKLIENQLKSNNIKDADDESFYSQYHKLDEINQWIDDLQKQYPDLVSSFKVGTSFEKREIRALKIAVPSDEQKLALWIDGGIHAREWISVATVMHIAYSLCANYTTNDDIYNLLSLYDFYILPVINVDGYEYTWTTDRDWRKTRSRHRGFTCPDPNKIGVDPNRNWDSHFCECGASTDPCSDEYCGPRAFSEPEIKSVSDFLLSINSTLRMYINFHSFSQLWMIPYGYSFNLPKTNDDLMQAAENACNALEQVYGTQYQYGNIATIIYLASGSSADWVYDLDPDNKYTFGVELRDKGDYGFLLPADQIIPSGIETLQGILGVVKHMICREFGEGC